MEALNHLARRLFFFFFCYRLCAVDILKKTDSGYDFYEVKNAGEVHKQFIRDAAFQYYILSRCKIKVGKIYIVTHSIFIKRPALP